MPRGGPHLLPTRTREEADDDLGPPGHAPSRYPRAHGRAHAVHPLAGRARQVPTRTQEADTASCLAAALHLLPAHTRGWPAHSRRAGRGSGGPAHARVVPRRTQRPRARGGADGGLGPPSGHAPSRYARGGLGALPQPCTARAVAHAHTGRLTRPASRLAAVPYLLPTRTRRADGGLAPGPRPELLRTRRSRLPLVSEALVLAPCALGSWRSHVEAGRREFVAHMRGSRRRPGHGPQRPRARGEARHQPCQAGAPCSSPLFSQGGPAADPSQSAKPGSRARACPPPTPTPTVPKPTPRTPPRAASIQQTAPRARTAPPRAVPPSVPEVYAGRIHKGPAPGPPPRLPSTHGGPTRTERAHGSGD
ncbi:hypothetical protein a10_02779 [Streptomyces acidiscabies]|nr:hypothetical protein a10_02779 [Streptomyces acidiscabies]GAV43248.1 hypothetical protein Saa2_06199 [Streptomyces acidiscabies]